MVGACLAFHLKRISIESGWITMRKTTDPENQMEVGILEEVVRRQALVDLAWDWTPLDLRHCKSL